jgi:hypothetical protein
MVEVGLHISCELAYGYHGIAQARFRAIECTTPIVNFFSRPDVDARGIV